eukprot:Em0001g130a
MKSLAVLVVFGCLVAENLGTRFHTKHHEVKIDGIDENKARKLVTGIKAENPKTFTQYAVLCLVPISLGQPTYQDLTKVGFCTNAAYPSFDGQIHSEDKLLPRVNTLKTKYLKSATYKATQYDIFLFSYNSPCPRTDRELQTTNCPAEDLPQPTIGCELPMASSPEDIADFALYFIVEYLLLHSGVPTTEKLETSRLFSYCFNNTSEIYQPKQMDAFKILPPQKRQIYHGTISTRG